MSTHIDALIVEMADDPLIDEMAKRWPKVQTDEDKLSTESFFLNLSPTVFTLLMIIVFVISYWMYFKRISKS